MTTPPVKYLKDYRPPVHLVDQVSLAFDLEESHVTVTSELSIRRNPEASPDTPADAPLVLDGRGIELVEITLNGAAPEPGRYELGPDTLTVASPPSAFTLRTVGRIKPQNNKALEGLYRSGPLFCTQCEAEGFRHITWFPDRPDVMARFSCEIRADRAAYPVMLSNGNHVAGTDLPDGRHWARWEDPFPKPCYLFALVAGDLHLESDTFVTSSGRTVDLRIYVEHDNADKCGYAMQSLKKAMKWDEEVFGREYDLDIYMIVAVKDFNMGAMENKGLNVFNAKYVLADPDTATDADFWGIERVIAHEYFHNWTGNRVTLRNWFQLSLKEGLTVFRDQEFSMDMTSRPVKRITDVRALRSSQFPEDAGPMAHPVRPSSYIKMDNFYTVTVYEKGAEVIRMIHTLLGREAFRKGMDLYFQRHDGQAVTLEDFLAAMADASGRDLSGFLLWYAQAGTPVARVRREYDAARREYRLTLEQATPPTPDMAEKSSMPIPMAVGLLDGQGRDIPLRMAGDDLAPTTRILEFTRARQTFTFTDVPEAPTPSLFRGFSAPVKLVSDLTTDERYFLFAHDSDEFNRWDAGQVLLGDLLLNLARTIRRGETPVLDERIEEPFRNTLIHKGLDKSFIAQALNPPTETELAIRMSECGEEIDPDAIHEARWFFMSTLGMWLKREFTEVFEENIGSRRYEVTPEAVGRRNLKNLALSYLGTLPGKSTAQFLLDRYEAANNMTDAVAALTALSHIPGRTRERGFTAFYRRWHADTLVLDKWFSLQAMSQIPDALAGVKTLLEHEAFSLKNPNKVRALIGAFCMGNPWRFHDASGDGYRFLADRVLEIDAFNPQIAARMVQAMNQWKKYDSRRQALMKAELECIAAASISGNLREIVARALA